MSDRPAGWLLPDVRILPGHRRASPYLPSLQRVRVARRACRRVSKLRLRLDRKRAMSSRPTAVTGTGNEVTKILPARLQTRFFRLGRLGKAIPICGGWAVLTLIRYDAIPYNPSPRPFFKRPRPHCGVVVRQSAVLRVRKGHATINAWELPALSQG